jgi:hypothetical protein
LRLIEGTAQRRQTGVAFFLVTFSLAKQEKVTGGTTSHLTNPANDAGLVIGYSCRATPDGFDFVVHASTGSARTALNVGQHRRF